MLRHDMSITRRMIDSSELERQFPLSLRAAYMALHRHSEAAFAEQGVTADQFVLLLAISDAEAANQRELADRISSDPSTVRAMLVLLEKNGYIERDSHPTDSRAKTVTLTPAGSRKLRTLWKIGQPIRKSMYESMDPAEAEQLLSLLQKMTRALKQEASCI